MSQSSEYADRLRSIIFEMQKRHAEELEPWTRRLATALEAPPPIVLRFATKADADRFMQTNVTKAGNLSFPFDMTGLDSIPVATTTEKHK